AGALGRRRHLGGSARRHKRGNGGSRQKIADHVTLSMYRLLCIAARPADDWQGPGARRYTLETPLDVKCSLRPCPGSRNQRRGRQPRAGADLQGTNTTLRHSRRRRRWFAGKEGVMRFVAVLNRSGGSFTTIDLEAFGARMREILQAAGHSLEIRICEGKGVVDALQEAA